MFARLTAAALILCIPVIVLAQPLADRVPEGAVAYVGWRGTNAMGPGYATSHLKAVVDASDLPKLLNEFIPRLIERIGKEDRSSAEIMNAVAAIGSQMWKHSSAFYLESIDFRDPQMPVPAMALLCDAGVDAPALLQQLNGALGKAPPSPVQVKAWSAGDLVVLEIGELSASAKGLAGVSGAAAGNPLSKSARFVATMAQVHRDPVAAIYVDGVGMLKLIDRSVEAGSDPQAKANWPKAREALGLSGLRAVAWAGGFEGKEWSSSAFASAPAPRKGILQAFAAGPMDQRILANVPVTATQVGSGQFDVSGLVDLIRSIAGQIDANGQAEFDQGLQSINQTLGLDIQKDFLASLGTQWVYYVDPTVGGNGALGMTVVNKLRDPAKAEQSLSRLEQFATGMLASQLQRQKITVAFRQTKVGDLTIHYLAVPAVSPAWTIKNGNLYVSLYPQVTAAAARYAGKSILDNPDFSILQKRLGGANVSAISFMDLPKTVPDGYQTWLMLSRLGLGMSDMFGVESPAMVVPPLNQILPHLSPAGAASWTDEAGIHFRAVSPFPGSEVLGAGGSMGSMSAAEIPVLVAILLPALSRARETANRAACANNLSQIGKGCIMYANDNEQKFPPDLGTMAATQEMPAKVFVCPGGMSATPPPGLQGEALTGWVNQNTTYVYLGAGKRTSVAATYIMAHEKFGNHGGEGINMLFGDGHVSWLTMPAARAAIQRQQQGGADLPRNGGL